MLKKETGGMIAAGSITVISVLIKVVSLIIGVPIVEVGTMDSITAGRGCKKQKTGKEMETIISTRKVAAHIKTATNVTFLIVDAERIICLIKMFNI